MLFYLNDKAGGKACPWEAWELLARSQSRIGGAVGRFHGPTAFLHSVSPGRRDKGRRYVCHLGRELRTRVPRTVLATPSARQAVGEPLVPQPGKQG